MVIQLNNPESPASKKQLWLLHILTQTDTRNLNITMQQASDQINELKNNGNGNNGHKSPARVNNRRHWNNDTFVITERGSDGNKYGYCSVCYGDMQRFNSDKLLRHYNSHKAAIRLGLWNGNNKPVNNPISEREVIQGDNPAGITDMSKINEHFMKNAYQLGREKAGNDTATIDFYDFQCRECLFGKTGVCQPSWRYAGSTTCLGVAESVSYCCQNYEPVKHSISDYCKRPKGRQCHRKKLDNHCLECNYRTGRYIGNGNRYAWATYIPTIQERIKRHQSILERFTERDNPEATEQLNNIISLLNKLA